MENEYEKINKISFKQKPVSLPPVYRPIYKISQILLVLHFCSRKESASLLKLHFFSWIMNSRSRINETQELFNAQRQTKIFFWRIEPALNRAINLALGEKLIVLFRDKYTLTETGKEFLNKILDDTDVLSYEKKFCKKIRKKISERYIENLAEHWGDM